MLKKSIEQGTTITSKTAAIAENIKNRRGPADEIKVKKAATAILALLLPLQLSLALSQQQKSRSSTRSRSCSSKQQQLKPQQPDPLSHPHPAQASTQAARQPTARARDQSGRDRLGSEAALSDFEPDRSQKRHAAIPSIPPPLHPARPRRSPERLLDPHPSRPDERRAGGWAARPRILCPATHGAPARVDRVPQLSSGTFGVLVEVDTSLEPAWTPLCAPSTTRLDNKPFSF